MLECNCPSQSLFGILTSSCIWIIVFYLLANCFIQFQDLQQFWAANVNLQDQIFLSFVSQTKAPASLLYGELFQTEKLSSCLTSVCADSSQLSGGDLWLPLTGHRNPALLLPKQTKSMVCLLPKQKLFVQHGVSPYWYLLVLVCTAEISVAVWEAARWLEVAARPEGAMPGIFQPYLSMVSGAWWHCQSLPSPKGWREWSARGLCWQLV